MGTRADFYLGVGEKAEWLGSIAWNGDPADMRKGGGNGLELLLANSEATYRDELREFLALRDHATLPDQGWPWPWSSSIDSHAVYHFVNDEVLVRLPMQEKYEFEDGIARWYRAANMETRVLDHSATLYPDMTLVMSVTWNERSDLGHPAPTAAKNPKYLVARWFITDSQAFIDVGHRDEMVMQLGRLADDIADSDVEGKAIYRSFSIFDTNGYRVGETTWASEKPDESVEGKPRLIVPVQSLERMAIAVKDVMSCIPSFIEDLHRGQIQEGRFALQAGFTWRELSSMERGRELSGAQIAGAAKIRDRMIMWDANSPFDMCGAFDNISAEACLIGLDAVLLGVNEHVYAIDADAVQFCASESVRVGYLKDGKLTGLSTSIQRNGRTLTTIDGERKPHTGYTDQPEWQRDQLRHAYLTDRLKIIGVLDNLPPGTLRKTGDIGAEMGGP
jgi:hypothetical protein